MNSSQQEKLSSLAARLTAAIRKRGVSGADVAREAGVDRGYISLLRSGGRKNPSAEVIEKIAKCLQVDVDWLLTGKGEMSDMCLVQESSAEYIARTADDFWEEKAIHFAGPWVIHKSDAATLRKFADNIMKDQNLSLDEKLEICGVLKKMIQQRS